MLPPMNDSNISDNSPVDRLTWNRTAHNADPRLTGSVPAYKMINLSSTQRTASNCLFQSPNEQWKDLELVEGSLVLEGMGTWKSTKKQPWTGGTDSLQLTPCLGFQSKLCS